jgi:hypothetical protein
MKNLLETAARYNPASINMIPETINQPFVPVTIPPFVLKRINPGIITVTIKGRARIALR